MKEVIPALKFSRKMLQESEIPKKGLKIIKRFKKVSSNKKYSAKSG